MREGGKTMRKLRNIFIMSVLAATCIFGTKENVSAKTKAVRPLSVNKKYYYNLDQKGAKEKVQVVKRVVTNENAKDYGWEYYSLKINDKVVLSNLTSAIFFVADTNTKDKQMEIFKLDHFNYDVFAADMSKTTYYRYYSSKLHKVQTIGSVAKKKYKGLSYTHYVSENNAFLVDSKGKLTYKVCIKLKNNLDMVHFNDTLILKNGKFTTSKTKSFSLKDEDSYLEFQSKGINKVYAKPGSKKVAFKLKNKERFYRKGFYLKNKNTYYIKIRTKNGKTGYIKNKEFKGTVNDRLHMSY